MEAVRGRLRRMLYGHSQSARLFRLALLLVDLATIIYFLVTIRVAHVGIYLAIDFLIFVYYFVELAIRYYISHHPETFWRRFSTWADVAVLVSLILPLLVANSGFIALLRTLRFIRSYRIMLEIKQYLPIPRKYEDVVNAAGNLVVFIFIVTSMVWVLQANTNDQITNWIDALYFTVTTLTTTGFGDITLKGSLGRLVSVFIMIFGVALFLRLAQAVFRPYKVYHVCPSCALTRHDPDAVHCKHCGIVLEIENEGDW